MPGANAAFYPQLGSINIALTSVASVGVSPSSAGWTQGLQIFNQSTNDAYVWFFPTSTGAATLSTLQSTGTLGNYYPIPQRATRTISCAPNVFISGVTTAAGFTAVLTLTPGYGIP